MEVRSFTRFTIFLLLALSVKSAVIGIDFGSEFYKTVVVRPGAPFNIVENTGSDRKTENAITLTDEERLYEKRAVKKSVSYPQTALINSLNLLGLEYSDENIRMLKEDYLYTNEFTEDSRGLIGYNINIPEVDELTNIDMFIEEALTMTLQHARKLSNKAANGVVNDITITVPSYFTINQRTMVKDAAELAGFNVLTLLNENTAAALMYGIDTPNLELPKKVLFVNMGSKDLELSIVKYYNHTTKNVLSTHVIEEAANPNVGGHLFDTQLVRILAERFDNLPERQGKNSIMENPKIIKRLMREVVKVKEILSSNKEAQIKLIEIADNLNLEFTLHRSEFEERIMPIIEKSRQTFLKVLENHPVDTIDDVEILGGGLRVPKVKEFITEMLGGKLLGTHLNPDEAMAFGSAYIAANSSSNYQVKKVYLYQSVPDTVYANITQMGGCKSEHEEDCFFKHLKLYAKEKNVLGQRKTINIEHHIENMNVVLYTVDSDGAENIISKTKIRGVDKIQIFKKDISLKEKYKLVIAFKYDKSGILTIKHASVVSDTKDSHFLNLIENLAGPSPLNAAQKKKIKKRLREADLRDKKLEKLKIIKNEFESLIYSSKEYLQDEDIQPYLKNEDEKIKLLLYLDEEQQWLETTGLTADYDNLKNKVRYLEKKINPIKKRKSQREQLADLIEKYQTKLDKAEKSFERYTRIRKKWLPEDDLEEFKVLLTQAREYFISISEFDNYPKNQKLPFKKSDLDEELKKVTRSLKSIKKIKKAKAEADVESHGELSNPVEDVIPPGVTDNIGIEDIPNDNFEGLQTEDIANDQIKVENIGEDGVPQFSEEQRAKMKEQVSQMRKKEQLKYDVISGKIDPETLSAEEREEIGL
ncbi:unnamed protein product [Moneuplotes crassus]|uniref:Uncharacterized protein n=2 Tax=Euplotes crassus TaxID=5936 RepID=A0AAD2D9B7_EUPCR|nr:unnamed protein product [Moneuplotes crassus]